MSPIRAFLFLSTLVLVSIAINVLQQLSLPIVFSRVSRYYYRRWISFTESLFGALIVFCTWVFSPTTIRIGAASKETWDAMVQDEGAKNLLISNHQALVDWWYLWIVAHREGRHGDFKIILKESLKFLPIFGWGMYFYEFIFLKRKWAFDKAVLEKATRTIQSDIGLPCWLLIFPEGTVNDPPGIASSKSYSKKIDLPYPYTHVLLPKSTGLFFILRHLRLESLYDVTLAYPHKTGNPTDDYPITKVFFEGKGPGVVDVHLRRFPISEVPGIAESWVPPTGTTHHGSGVRGEFETDPAEKARHEAFTEWLRDRFLEKDELMTYYAKHGKFPDAVPKVEGLKVIGQGPKEDRHEIVVEVKPTNWDFATLLLSTVFSQWLLWKGIAMLQLSMRSVGIGLAVLGVAVVAVVLGTGTIRLGKKKHGGHGVPVAAKAT